MVIFFQSVLAHEQLRVSLEDLYSAESGGCVGRDPLVDNQVEFRKTTGVSASNEDPACGSQEAKSQTR